MCFNKEMTLAFSILACVFGGWVFQGKGIWKIELWRRVRISACFFWFAFMEFLQFVEYVYIDECTTVANRIWTMFGYLHICFQPFFSNLALSALDKRNLTRDPQRDGTWIFIFKFCLAAGFCMSLRMFIPEFWGDQQLFKMCTDKIEGFCSPRTCSTTGIFHVQWEFKLLKPLYMFPGIAIHFMNMFVAPALMGQTIGSLVLFMTGPFMAVFYPVRDGEKSAIWCFFSIAESFITVMTQYLAVRNSYKKIENKSQ